MIGMVKFSARERVLDCPFRRRAEQQVAVRTEGNLIQADGRDLKPRRRAGFGKLLDTFALIGGE